ncbi:MAG: helix-turn-helix domain-containing protein [Ferrovum myxofaciens]|nr:transposase [Ferrovum myxofaciens]MBU6995527.1 helix-turn-helix domain-containing protein [Ferrovum myxofaciens]
MKRLQAFKYELQPNGEQARSMRRFAGSCRFVFNKALAMQKAIYEGGEKKLGYAGLCKELTTWKNSTGNRLAQKETHSQVLQQSLKDLERAYKKLFSISVPTFHGSRKKGMGDSFRYPPRMQARPVQ